MQLTIRYLASLRETLGASEESLSLKGPSCRLNEVRDRVAKRLQQMAPEKRRHLLCALNGSICSKGDNPQLQDGDEVAFFPPMTGG